MEHYGHLGDAFEALAERVKLDELYAVAPAWDKKHSTPEAVALRREQIKQPGGFWKFDTWYFPPEAYDGQYAKPSRQFHGVIIDACGKSARECSLVIGPHDHAKSSFIYKKIVHAILTGERHFVGLVSQTLETPTSILKAVSYFIQTNERIRHDFPDLKIDIDSAEEMHLRTRDNRSCWVKCFSEWKSPRGKNVDLFQRPDWIVIEDFENVTSSMEPDMVEKRRRKLAEYQSALAEDGTLTMTSNNFHPECVSNKMLLEYQQGTLDRSWTVMHFDVWYTRGERCENSHLGPLWPERFPASTIEELRAMLKPMDEDAWLGSYRGRPRKPQGFYFASAAYREWTQLPKDIVALLWCDPNLADKSKGDTTAMHAMLFSRSTGSKYIVQPRCRSFRDSNELLDSYFDIVRWLYEMRITIAGMGFDGNVSQESHWLQHLRNYAFQKKIPMPRVEFKKYRVADLAKNTQVEFNEGRFLFPKGFAQTEEGKRYLEQLWAFSGTKRSGTKDDAPDALICVNEFLYEKGYTTRPPMDLQYHSLRKRRVTPLERY